ncbi:MAG: hypothetical protein K6G55_07125 [Selenomonadaceae bacterium]|nr:hypothetical protein [Selenomonadaceae bacterium]
MTKKIFLTALVCLISLAIFSVADAKKSEYTWRLDGNASADLPKHFRLMTDDWQNTVHGKEPTRDGLDYLFASASAQPSEAAMTTLYKKLKEIAPSDYEIYIVDLRQESHGFANSLPVSWHAKYNNGNANKSVAEIMKDERKRLGDTRGTEIFFQALGKEDSQNLKSIAIVPRVIRTEEDVATDVGFTYVRLAAADMQFPSPNTVEEFMNFVATVPDNSWLHFHCQGGQGRTTTFLAMYDMMRNPDISFEDICKRQYLLGGTNLLLEPVGDDWYSTMARARAKKLRIFYEYMQGVHSKEVGSSWSLYLESKLSE